MTRRAAVLRLLALLAVIGAAIVVAVILGIPTATQLRSHFTGMGAWAPLPKSVFTLAAGAVFGLAEGLLVVLAGAIIGAVLAFYLARARTRCSG